MAAVDKLSIPVNEIIHCKTFLFNVTVYESFTVLVIKCILDKNKCQIHKNVNVNKYMSSSQLKQKWSTY